MIRKLRASDLPQVALIESATQAVPWTDTIFKDCLQTGYPGWVYEKAGKVVGFTLISVRGDEGHLLNLGVHPEHQRQGVGSALLEQAIQAAKKQGAMMIYLEVRETNARAIALYKKRRFVKIGLRKDYYPAPLGRENGLVYALDLGS